MDSDRSSKRRKLNTPTKLSTQSSAAAKLAELRQSRSAIRTDHNATVTPEDSASIGKTSTTFEKEQAIYPLASIGDGQTIAANVVTKHTPARGSAKKSTIENSSKGKTGPSNANTNLNGDTPSKSATKSHRGRTNEQKDAEDVDMTDRDAGQAIAVSRETIDQDIQGEEDVDTSRRTTGRRRQPSKKLQESTATPEPATKRRTPRSVKTEAVRPSPKPSEEAAVAIEETDVVPKLKRRRKLSDLSQQFIQPVTAEVEPALVEAATTPTLDSVTAEKPKRTPRGKANSKKEIVPVAEPREVDVDVDIIAHQSHDRSPEINGPVLTQTTSHSIIERPPVEEENVPFDESVSIPPDHIAVFQTSVLRRITRQVPYRLVGLDNESAKIESLIQQTVVAGESNSMMVIGARGSGKSAIVENIIQNQRSKHGDDFHVVRLNGFIHTDDKIALRDIWHQLGREMEMEDDMLVKNYADTLTTLLALLSHPADIGQESTGVAAKSIIFILDEFELFASHPRQTLLYNLFDIAQSRKAPIAVLGLTTRLDVAESLEKRVKSRFSHRSVYLPLAKNFAAFRETCQSIMTISTGDAPSNANADFSTSRQAWNAMITTLFETIPAFTTHLHKIYFTTKSIPDFQTSMLLPISTLPITTTMTASLLTHLLTTLASAPSLLPPDNRLTLLSSLSTLGLSLLIAAARLSIIHDTETCTFALAYDEYKSLASKARITASASGALATGSGARVWSQATAAGAWEGLIDAGLVLAMSERRTGDATKALCRVDVSLEELGWCADNGEVEMTSVMTKWCKEI